LGAGGMGQVYLAEHRHMKRRVAIKILSPEAMLSEAAVKRFQREVEAAARLTHPNIVRAYDANEQNGVWHLVMEYVDGSDLAAVVQDRGPLPVAEAAHYIVQAARGLAYAHAAGIVHRDIKPANLLVDRDGVVKILDMGLARFDSEPESLDHQLTRDGQVMGTIDYMAPEQAANTRAADARSDIYSLGCTLFRLLTGESIYAGETLVAKLLAHQTAPVPSLCPHRPDVPAELNSVFQRLVAKSPGDRFATAQDVATALQKWADGFQPSAANLGGKSSVGETSAATIEWSRPATGTAVKSDATATHLQPPVKVASPTLSVAAPRRSAAVWIGSLAVVAALAVAVGWIANSGRQPSPPEERPMVIVPRASEPADPFLPEFIWSQPVNLGAGVNSASREASPALTDDELLLVFTRGARIWESRRAQRTDEFPSATELPGPVNGQLRGQTSISISGDGLLLVFTSTDQPTGESLWQSVRSSRDRPFGEPVRITKGYIDRHPAVSADGLCLAFTRHSGTAKLSLWRRDSRESDFLPADEQVAAANTSRWVVANDFTHDGLGLLTSSKVDEATSPMSLHFHTRPDRSSPFGVGKLLPAEVGQNKDRAVLSADRGALYFHARDLTGSHGDLDLWVIRRTKKTLSP
jgi:serine/threonine protein kinase